jgi:hypothetical protein
VIIHDFHVITIPGSPHETNPPLLVDPDRMLSLPVSAQCLQLISGRRRQHPQFCCGVQLQEFPERHPLEGTKPPRMLVVKEFLGLRARKTLNHTPSIPRYTLYAKSVTLICRGCRSLRCQRLRVLTSPPPFRLRPHPRFFKPFLLTKSVSQRIVFLG